MEKVIVLYKPVGVTPLQLIQHFQEQYPAYKKQKLSYAGRLDPMADGILLILVGDENKKRKIYEALPKEYCFEVLFGITTDTYDILGKISPVILSSALQNEESPLGLKDSSQSLDDQRSKLSDKLRTLLPSFLGTKQQLYPPYSSFHIKNKPLFYWAREGKLDTIVIPSKTIEITSLSLEKTSILTTKQLKKTVEEKINLVKGNFRQSEILQTWSKFFSQNPDALFSAASFSVTCSSGTYVRSLAHEMGQKLSTGAIALSITRTKVGKFTIDKSLRI